MIRPRIRITFTQHGTEFYPDRANSFVMQFVHECEITSSWKNLTGTCKITFPKNIIIRRADGTKYDLSSTVNMIGGSEGSEPPLFARGDSVKVEECYWYYDAQGNEQRPDYYTTFEGWITKVKTKVPIELDCEDNMYQLKQIQIPKNKRFYPSNKWTAETMVKDLLQGTGFTLADPPSGVSTNIGDFRIVDDITIGRMLEILQKDYHIESWFRGTVLHSSAIVYYPNDPQQKSPVFQDTKNIVQNDLDYTRQDDILMGAKAISVNKTEATKVNSRGHATKVHKRLEAFVGRSGGDVRTLWFYDIATVAELKKQGELKLRRFYYEGFRGNFTTFGEPYTYHGDLARIQSLKFPDTNGTYFVKSVTRTSGVGGRRQKIELDLRVNESDSDKYLSQQDIAAGI